MGRFCSPLRVDRSSSGCGGKKAQIPVFQRLETLSLRVKFGHHTTLEVELQEYHNAYQGVAIYRTQQNSGVAIRSLWSILSSEVACFF